MTERERLTELLNESLNKGSEFCLKQDCSECSYYKMNCWGAVNADYLLANGVIVPPCKVGSSVFRIVEMGTGIHYKQVGRCGIGHAKGYKIVPCEEKTKRFIRSVVVTKNNFFDVYENWGKTVFLSRELAEKALAERSKA